MGVILVAMVGLVAVAPATQGNGVQLFNAEVLGQPTSSAVRLLVAKDTGDAEPFVVWADVACGEYIAASAFYRKPVTFDLLRSAVNKVYGSFEMPLFKGPTMALWRVTDPAKVPGGTSAANASPPAKPEAVMSIQLAHAEEETVRLTYILGRRPSCSPEAKE